MKSREASAADAPLVEMYESLLPAESSESDAEVWRSGGTEGRRSETKVRRGHAHLISASFFQVSESRGGGRAARRGPPLLLALLQNALSIVSIVLSCITKAERILNGGKQAQGAGVVSGRLCLGYAIK